MDKAQKGMVVTVLHNKGFGFIKQEDGSEIFFHASGVCNPAFEELREGYLVEYMTADSPKGKKAIGVVAV